VRRRQQIQTFILAIQGLAVVASQWLAVAVVAVAVVAVAEQVTFLAQWVACLPSLFQPKNQHREQDKPLLDAIQMLTIDIFPKN
jgi:hypothetical protein